MRIAITCLTAGLSLALLVAGCAGLKNTLAQDLAWDRWQQCSGKYPTVTLKEITPEGQIWLWNYAGTDWAGAQECLRQAADDQAKRRIGVAPAPQDAKTLAIAAPAQAVPLWSVGDEWAYRYERPGETGTYVWRVDRVEKIDGSDHFVVKTGTREIFYRISDYAASHETVAGSLVVKNTPPRLNVKWPLTVGKTWTQTIEEERPQDRQTTTRTWTWEVMSMEEVTVPAGTFKAFRVVARNKATGNTIFEMWVSPEVKQFVKVREWLAVGGIRDRELIAFRLK